MEKYFDPFPEGFMLNFMDFRTDQIEVNFSVQKGFALGFIDTFDISLYIEKLKGDDPD